MSCCEPANAKTFLEAKLKNFRAFLEPHCSTAELKAKLAEYKDLDTVMPYLSQLVALAKVGHDAAINTAVESFLAQLPALRDDEAFVSKLRRYMEMFVDVLTS